MIKCLIVLPVLGFKAQYGFTMTKLLWRCVFLWVMLSVGVSKKDMHSEEGSSMGFLDLRLDLVASSRLLHVSGVKASDGGHAVFSRQKRNILFPNGVKLCAQETPQQVVANHLSYFHLRVCQETVWEAFKIFWDRLPQQEEYQSWMGRCQEGAISAQDVSSFFSQSAEHQAMVTKRLSLPGMKSEPTKSWQHMCSTPTPSPGGAAEAPQEGEKEENQESPGATQEEKSPMDNDIPLQPAASPGGLEQVVELSLLLNGEFYSTDLDDPTSLQYQMLSRQLEDKIEDALEGLPGFKSVSVIGFRRQMDVEGRDAVMMNYAVTVMVNGAGVSHQQLDFLTLQSNLVESSYRDNPVLHSTNAPQEPALETMSESPGSVKAADGDTVVSVVEPPEVLTLEYDAEDEPLKTVTMTTAGYDVVVLEESEVVPPALQLEISAHEAGSIEEEGLLVGDTAESLPKLPETATLPEPPVEIESSGLGVVDIKSLLEADKTTEDENKVSPEEKELISEEVSSITEAGEVNEEKNADPLDDQQQAEVVEDDVGDPEEFEVSTITTEITEYELSPAQVPSPDVKVEMEPSEPATSDINQIQDAGEPLAIPEDPPVEELNGKNVEHSEGSEGNQEGVPESEAPQISPEDLTDDEILLVNQDEPLLTESPIPVHPTALSPEAPSLFTNIHVDVVLEGKPDISPSLVEVQTPMLSSEDVPAGDHIYDVLQHGLGLSNHTEEGSTGFPFSVGHGPDQASIAMPANPGRALMVFFSLRVTNMIFSEDLFNKSSPEYKALEQRFLELLVPYLQSNLSHFENLEILNFRNGSIVVNSRMKFGQPVAHGVTSTVYLILEDFCNTAYQTMNLAIDKYSLDVESGDQADPCKFQACNEFSECQVNKWSGEAECVCNAGYFSVDGLPCQSICELQDDFCLNDGKCDIIPGQGAICRCRVGENWWYRGEHCEEYVSEPLVVGIAIASVAGFLLVASGVIFFLARTLRDQYDKDESEDPIRHAENLPSLERATKYNPMYESEATTGYSHYYRRYPEAPVYSSASAEASTDFSSEEIRHIYENSELTKEEIQDRIRIIELYTKDRQFADFVRHHQAVVDTRRESSSVHT